MASQVTKRPQIAPYQIEGICKSIGATDGGLTGTEIGMILKNNNIPDINPDLTKWKRLYNAFVNIQHLQQCSNPILNFLTSAMHPSRYIGTQELFFSRLNLLNKHLAFAGFEMTNKATYKLVTRATTISEAEERANHFKYKLEARNAHSEIFKYCNAELLVENYFHSVFEGAKSIADRIRDMSNLYADGNSLIDVAFSTTAPLIRLNLLQNDTHRSEHLGLANIIKGIFGLIRNPTAHTPKIKFIIEEEEALDIMTLISFVHKKLDKAF